MTENEAKLLDAVLKLDIRHSRDTEELAALRRAVATERLNAAYPSWYKDFFNLGVPHLLAERRFNRLKELLMPAGVITNDLWDELFKAAAQAEEAEP
jgi:hypothetical protein